MNRDAIMAALVFGGGSGGFDILNKNGEAINATLATVQSVATTYISTNYSRQPKDKDALVITLTDQSNDKVLYLYSASSTTWVNVGVDVDLTAYYTKTETTTLVGARVATEQGVAHAGKFLIVGADGNVAPTSMQEWQGGNY